MVGRVCGGMVRPKLFMLHIKHILNWFWPYRSEENIFE